MSDQTMPCVSCGKLIPCAAINELRPGRQFTITCPHCHYEVRGGVGMPSQQNMAISQQQQSPYFQNALMSCPQTPDWEDATARAMLPPIHL